MGDIYRPLFLRDFPIVYTGLETAELIKYAANAFLATKISFINEIAALCERLLAEGFRVHGYDGMTDYYDVRLKRRRHQMLLQNPNFSATEGMLEDQAPPRRGGR